MDNNDNKRPEAESLFATRRKKQQQEEAERAKLEELERQKQQMAAEIARLEQMQSVQAAENSSAPDRRKKLIPFGIAGAGAVILIAVIGIALSKTAGSSGTNDIVTETSVSSETSVRNESSTTGSSSEKTKETSAEEHKTELSQGDPAENDISYDGNIFNGHRYEFVSEDISWTDARERCHSMGGHLVTVSSYEENAFLEQLVSRNNAWIGAYFDGDTWRWVTDEPWEYDNWAPGEPSYSDGDEWCCQFSRNQDMYWNDVGDYNPIDDHDGFICEYDDLTDPVFGSDPGNYGDYSVYNEESYDSESIFMQTVNSYGWDRAYSEDGSFSFDVPSFFEYSGDDYFYYTGSSGETTAFFIDLYQGFFEDIEGSERDESLISLMYMIGEETFGLSRDDDSVMWYDGDTVYATVREEEYYSMLICGCSGDSAVIYCFTTDNYSDNDNYITDGDVLNLYDITRGSLSYAMG